MRIELIGDGVSHCLEPGTAASHRPCLFGAATCQSVGVDAVVQGVFMPLVQDYEGFTVKPEAFVGEGDSVVAVGWYEGRFKATGKVSRARFAHVWTIRDGKVSRFEQVVDSATWNEALT